MAASHLSGAAGRRAGLYLPEHETSWRASGAEVVTVRSLLDLAGIRRRLVVNPNNPDGRRFALEDLAEIAGR